MKLILLVIGISLSGAPVYSPGSAVAAGEPRVQPRMQTGISITELLGSDGRLDLSAVTRPGAVNLSGYHISLAEVGPVAAPLHAEYNAGTALEGFWTALDQGTNGEVLAMAVDSEGNLYVAGDFTQAGGATVNRIAMWDGTVWSPLGTGITGLFGVYALAVDQDDNLYAGGSFTTAGGVEARDIAMWDGAVWSALGSPPFGIGVEVLSLAVDSEGTLYAGGSWPGVPTDQIRLHNIAKWDGDERSGLGNSYDEDFLGRVSQGVNSEVHAIVIDPSDRVYVGGSFSTAGGEMVNAPADYVAVWDGSSWSSPGDGGPGLIFALAIDAQDALYAGGIFSLGDYATGNVALWETGQVTTVSDDEPVRATSIELTTAYPNPFNPQTRFTLSLAAPQPITVTIHDVLGRDVAQLNNGTLPAGERHLTWTPEQGIPGGIYVIRAEGDHAVRLQRVVYVK